MPEPFPTIGMSPAVWGPILWTAMHIVTLGYSELPMEQEKKAATDFFHSLVHMIPCPLCKEHYKLILEKNPIEQSLGNRTDLVHWVFMIHNKVNEQLGKPQITIQQYIENLNKLSRQQKFQIPPTESKTDPNQSMPLYLGLGILIGAGISAAGLYYYQKNK